MPIEQVVVVFVYQDVSKFDCVCIYVIASE